MQPIILISVLAISQTQILPTTAQPTLGVPVAIEAKQPTPVQGEFQPSATTERCWFGLDYLGGWINGNYVPPLVTSGTGAANPGVLGLPGTTVLFGDERLGGDYRSGARINLGWWLDCDRACAIEARFFWLLPSNSSGAFGSPGQPVISRPFFNPVTGDFDAQLVTLPGVVAGAVTVDADSGPFFGGDVAFRKKLCCGCNYRIDGLFGYRFLYFRDRIEINEALATTDPAAIPTTFLVNDRFAATNTFHGLDFGLTASTWWNRAALDVSARVAFGDVHRNVQIDGSTAVTVQGQPTVVHRGGLLALPSNMARYESDDFAIVPELGVGVSYQITRNLRARAGYTFLLWPRVARAGDQIDTVVNPNLIPPPVGGGPARPAFMGNTETLWLHSLNVGLEFKF